MENGECGMWNVERGTGNGKRGMRNEKSGIRNAESQTPSLKGSFRQPRPQAWGRDHPIQAGPEGTVHVARVFSPREPWNLLGPSAPQSIEPLRLQNEPRPRFTLVPVSHSILHTRFALPNRPSERRAFGPALPRPKPVGILRTRCPWTVHERPACRADPAKWGPSV